METVGAGEGSRGRGCRRSLRLLVKSDAVVEVAAPEVLLDLRDVLLRVKVELSADELRIVALACLDALDMLCRAPAC